jgi:hypothetical protein
LKLTNHEAGVLEPFISIPTTSKGEKKLNLTLIIEKEATYTGWFDPEDTLRVISQISLDMTHNENKPLANWRLTNRYGDELPFTVKLKDSGIVGQETVYLNLREEGKEKK